MADPRMAMGQPLQPCPWRLPDPPPLPQQDVSRPLVLLVDRRDPLLPRQRDGLLASLSPGEHQRHRAYRRPDDRERYLLGRAGVRLLLAAWLGCPAAAVSIESGLHGKPHCPGGPAFNLSHSGDLILIALHPRSPVGVDVERLRPGLDWAAIAGRVLPEQERQVLAGLPAASRLEGFLQLWCQLEAELKVGGGGLVDLKRRRVGGTTPLMRHWPLRLPAGYLGAVALVQT